MAIYDINKLKHQDSNNVYGLTDYRLTGGSPGQILVADENNALTWVTTLSQTPTQASIDANGLISYKNSAGTTLFTLQLPLYDGGAM